MSGFTVLLNGNFFDEVFFDKSKTCSEVKKSLIIRDGYPSNIVVKPTKF